MYGWKEMGEKSMGETLRENFVKRMGEKRWAKSNGWKLYKSMGENFVKSKGEERLVKKVWVKTL